VTLRRDPYEPYHEALTRNAERNASARAPTSPRPSYRCMEGVAASKVAQLPGAKYQFDSGCSTKLSSAE